MEFQTAYYTDIGGRGCNEDSVRIHPHARGSLCVVVADGLGGHGGGDRASQAAVETICTQWNGGTTPQSLIGPIQEAHQAICSMQTAETPMRSTVVAMAINSLGLAHAHAGDSRF